MRIQVPRSHPSKPRKQDHGKLKHKAGFGSSRLCAICKASCPLPHGRRNDFSWYAAGGGGLKASGGAGPCPRGKLIQVARTPQPTQPEFSITPLLRQQSRRECTDQQGCPHRVLPPILQTPQPAHRSLHRLQRLYCRPQSSALSSRVKRQPSPHQQQQGAHPHKTRHCSSQGRLCPPPPCIQPPAGAPTQQASAACWIKSVLAAQTCAR